MSDLNQQALDEAVLKLLHAGTHDIVKVGAASHYERTGRDLAALGYAVGRWTDDLCHAEPCDCDLDEEQVGDRCMDNSPSHWALMRDEGAHGWSMAYPLSPGYVAVKQEDLVALMEADDWTTVNEAVARLRPQIGSADA